MTNDGQTDDRGTAGFGMTTDAYEVENLQQQQAEHDTFTVERYQQIAGHLGHDKIRVLDVGCSTGRGGLEFAIHRPNSQLWGIDVVQSRLDQLPDVYVKRLRGLSTDLPVGGRRTRRRHRR